MYDSVTVMASRANGVPNRSQVYGVEGHPLEGEGLSRIPLDAIQHAGGMLILILEEACSKTHHD